MAKRLIDLDEALKQLRDYADRKHLNGHNDTANGILKAVSYIRNNMTTVDAVEVVRCENCERSKLDGFYCCGADMMPPHKTFPHCFCSYGERKGGQAPQREDEQ